jgi:hypothetical protein
VTDRQDLVEYDGGQLSQYEDVGSDVREAYERHKTSTEVIEYDDSRSLGDVIRSSVSNAKNKADWKAQREHGSGASLARHWDTLPRGVRADVKDLAQWRDFGAPLAPYEQLCRTNGTNLLNAVHGFNQLENMFLSDPVEAIMFVCQRKGLDPGVMARCFWQRVYDPQGWAAGRVNNLSYQTGAAHMESAARNADMAAYFRANPGAEHLRNEMADVLSRYSVPQGLSNWQMLDLAHAQALKDARAKAAAIKKASKAVGGSPPVGRGSGSSGSGNSTRDAILAAIDAQHGTV